MIEIEQGNKIGIIFLEGEHLNRGCSKFNRFNCILLDRTNIWLKTL